MTPLRAATAALEQRVNDTLGDEITYTPAVGGPATFNAWVEFGSQEFRGGGSAAITDDIVVEVPVAKVALPAPVDRITIALIPGVTFGYAKCERGETGDAWRLTLKKVAA